MEVTSQGWIATPEVVEDRSDIAASETPAGEVSEPLSMIDWGVSTDPPQV